MSDRALLEARHLYWPDCPNVRDLGGLPSGVLTAIGPGAGAPLPVRRGRIVRSDLPAPLTEEGWQALVRHGVRTLIDLRSPREVQGAPYALPAAATAVGVARLNLSMLPLDEEMMALLRNCTSRGEEYILFVENYQAPIAVILRAIGAAQPGGVLYHCQAGKDRTGIITALLLGLAGVPENLIIADYAVSESLLEPRWKQEVHEALAAGIEPPFRPRTEPETMQALLDHLRARYGGPEGYLEAMRITAAERQALLGRLLH